MNRDLIDLALVSGMVGVSADYILAGAIFIFGGVLVGGREFARLARR